MPEATNVTIDGLSFSIPQPFTEGHVLKANEASALNQTYAENLRNNFASKVKKAKEEAEKAGTEPDLGALQSALDEYITTYEFGVRRGGGGGAGPKDAVEREAYAIAREKIKAAAKKKGFSISAEDVNTRIPDVLTKYPQIMDEARRIVESRKQIAVEELDFEPSASGDQPAGEGSPEGQASPQPDEGAGAAETPRGRRGRAAA